MSTYAVGKYLGISSHTVRRYLSDKRLPEPDVQIGEPPSVKYGWSVETIDAWNAARPGKGGRPRKGSAAS
ncbi:transcriptional regulator [Actinomycetaceae bacterium TAE3-ERU4]|nr:transcriptional regulator [Actinomycetaceae bacterium TAE3-ERU4]